MKKKRSGKNTAKKSAIKNILKLNNAVLSALRGESEEIMKKFIIHWVNGTTEEITGTDISNAFMLAGYGGGALQAVGYWEESKEDSYDPTKHGAVVAITPTKEER